MARRQKRKAHDTVSSEQATTTDFSPSQTTGLKYVPKFKKAKLKTTEDVAEHEQDATACSNTNPDIENPPPLKDFVKQDGDDISMHLPHLDHKTDSSSDSDLNEDALLPNSLPGAEQQTIQRSLQLINLLDDENKDTFLQNPPCDGITNSKQDCCRVVSIPTSEEENEAVLPHTPQTLKIAPSDNQSLFEDAQSDKLVMAKGMCLVGTPVKPVCEAHAMSSSRHNQTCKPSDGVPNEVISLNNADTVVPQVDEASVPSYSEFCSDDLLQESVGHSKVEAGTEVLRGLIDELSSLKRELESARRQRNAWLKMQKHLNKEVR